MYNSFKNTKLFLSVGLVCYYAIATKAKTNIQV